MKMKEPPMGSVVIDSTGSAWQRHPRGWSMNGSDGSWNSTWNQLVKYDLNSLLESPSKDWAPVLTDHRLPCIVYVPHEELIWDEEDLV